jgi:hypothetical protein
LGIVHLAGEGMKDRRWRLETLQGDTVETMLTYEAVSALTTTPAAERGVAAQA